MAVDPLAGERVLAFDTETTGISTTRSRIVQFALVGSDVNGEPVHIEHIVDPRCPIPLEASQVHGIYDGDVRGAPVFRDVADELHEAIEGAVLVGHNVPSLRHGHGGGGIHATWPASSPPEGRVGHLGSRAQAQGRTSAQPRLAVSASRHSSREGPHGWS